MKTIFHFLFTLSILASAAYQGVANGKPMEFTIGSEPQRCGDPGCGGWINAIGEITPSTPSEFEAFLAQTPYPPLAIRFTSPGGSLIAGIKLGEIIRKHKFNTETIMCASACAYAFFGGIERSFVDENSKLGVHRFYHSKALQNPTLQQFSGSDLDDTQQLMAGLLLYAMKMDIDLRILAIAAEAGPEEMRWLSLEEARELRVIYTPNRWLPWKVKPVGKGLIAYSETENKMRYMQLACSDNEGASFSLLDEDGDEAWLKQCISANEIHPVLGASIPRNDINLTRHYGSPVLNVHLGSQRITYKNSGLFNDTSVYPMACISQFDRYAGTTEKIKQAGNLALKNCIK